jgi:hypothetical protein
VPRLVALGATYRARARARSNLSGLEPRRQNPCGEQHVGDALIGVDAAARLRAPGQAAGRGVIPCRPALECFAIRAHALCASGLLDA